MTMAPVGQGTRPGSQPEHQYPGWKYTKAESPAWKALRENGREVMRWESTCQDTIAACERVIRALNVALVMLHGGHVENGALAAAGNMTVDMDPEQVVAHVLALVPKNFAPLAKG